MLKRDYVPKSKLNDFESLFKSEKERSDKRYDEFNQIVSGEVQRKL